MRPTTHEMTADDIWCWLLENGWEEVQTERWGRVAVRPDYHAASVRKSRSANVLAGDVAHCLDVPSHMVRKAVRAGWSHGKLMFAAGDDELHEQMEAPDEQ